MDIYDDEGYWVPESVRGYLKGLGYSVRALEEMEPYLREWESWMRAVGDFADVAAGLPYVRHRPSLVASRVLRVFYRPLFTHWDP